MLETIPRSEPGGDGDDLSAPISGPLLAAAPWAWIVRLAALYEDGSDAVYTGWLASPRVVVTSGRCLFDPSRGTAREVLVETGQNRASFGPRAVKSTDFRQVKGWVNGTRPECDYGAVLIPDTAAMAGGHFGLAWLPGARPKGEWLNLAGYTVDESSTAQWYEGFQVADTDDRFLSRAGGFHGAGAGSPLWLYLTRNGRAQRYVCGLVSSNTDRGEAMRLHRDIYDNLVAWVADASDAGYEPS